PRAPALFPYTTLFRSYDPRTVRRIWAFVRPYQAKIYLSVGAVLVFTASQLAIPLIIGRAIDSGMNLGGDSTNLAWAVAAFAVAVDRKSTRLNSSHVKI